MLSATSAGGFPRYRKPSRYRSTLCLASAANAPGAIGKT